MLLNKIDKGVGRLRQSGWWKYAKEVYPSAGGAPEVEYAAGNILKDSAGNIFLDIDFYDLDEERNYDEYKRYVFEVDLSISSQMVVWEPESDEFGTDIVKMSAGWIKQISAEAFMELVDSQAI